MIRLYFNRRGAEPWSVDSGPGTKERTFTHVNCEIPGYTVYQPLLPGEDPQTVPCAWVEFRNARLVPMGKSASIARLTPEYIDFRK